MNYLILTFGAVILFTLAFIAINAKFIFSLRFYHKAFDFGPRIVERSYRGHDFVASFEYETKESLMNMYHMREPNVLLLMDNKHKDYMIENFCRDLVKQMFEGGFVEVKEADNHHNPYMKRVDMRIKVYKPE